LCRLAAWQCVTVFPKSLVKPFELRKEGLRELYDEDRAAGRPGVGLPGALGRKMPRAGERRSEVFSHPGVD